MLNLFQHPMGSLEPMLQARLERTLKPTNNPIYGMAGVWISIGIPHDVSYASPAHDIMAR